MPTHADIDVTVIVVSFNTCELTRAALDSVAAETRETLFEVIAVDNKSNDGSAAMLAAHPLKPRVMALDNNIGFARANNLAATGARGKYLLLLNPDTVILDRAIDKLVAFARATPNAGIWGGRTLFADKSLNPSSCWGRMTAWNLFCRAAGLTAIFPQSALFNGEALGGWRRDSVRNVDIITGCFLLIEKTLWHRLNGFDPLFFMYGEEADLCLRARALSARPIVTPAAEIIHYGGASERVRADQMVRLIAAKSSLIGLHWAPFAAPVGRTDRCVWPLRLMNDHFRRSFRHGNPPRMCRPAPPSDLSARARGILKSATYGARYRVHGAPQGAPHRAFMLNRIGKPQTAHTGPRPARPVQHGAVSVATRADEPCTVRHDPRAAMRHGYPRPVDGEPPPALPEYPPVLAANVDSLGVVGRHLAASPAKPPGTKSAHG